MPRESQTKVSKPNTRRRAFPPQNLLFDSALVRFTLMTPRLSLARRASIEDRLQNNSSSNPFHAFGCYSEQNGASTHCGKRTGTSNGRNSNAKRSTPSGPPAPSNTVRCTGPRCPRREGDRPSRDFDISSREQRRARQKTQTYQIRTVR